MRFLHPSALWRASAALAAFCLLLASSALAQTTVGNIAGSVSDSATGRYLEGAEVALEGTAVRAITDKDGAFVLRGVPAGSQQLTVTYPGFEKTTAPVTVTAGQTVPAPIKLGEQVVQLNAYNVIAAKKGMAQAIALQKMSVQAEVVASGDQYGDIAEGNAAEYLKFLPGVGVDYNANDARAVTLRGMGTQFTNVTMDGDPIASATSGNLNRRFEFEQVSINNVETIQVVKTLTPDMQATSTAGQINFVSKSGFDIENNQTSYRAYLQADNSDLYLRKTEGWGQEKTRKVLPGLDLNYSRHLGEHWAINVGYKNSQLFNDYPRPQYNWDYNPADGGTPTAPVLTSFSLQNEQKDTRRQSMNLQVDWRLDENTKASLLGDWTFYDLLFTDRVTTVTPGVLPALSTTSATNQESVIQGQAGKGSVAFQTINRWKSGVTYDFPFNVSHTFPNGSELDGTAYWSQAYSKYRDTTGSWYSDATMTRSNLTIAMSNVGHYVPNYTAFDSTGAQVDLRDASQFNVTQIRSRPQTGVDTRSGYGGTYKWDLRTPIPVTLRVGGRVDYSTRNIADPIYNRTSFSPAVTGSQLASLVDTGFSNHPIGFGLPAYNFISLYSAYSALGGLSYLPYTPGSDTQARFEDTTSAGFARLDIKPIDNVLVVGGVRYEHRETDAENRLLTLPAPVDSKFLDRSWFPSVNVKYTPTTALAFRAGYSKSIGLPDYSDLLPGPLTITDPTATGRGVVSIYNPTLKAYHVDNYDLGVEYYFSHSGFIAASVFRKNISNYIISVTQSLDNSYANQLGIPISRLGAPVDQYDVTTKFNVPETGHYDGLELQFAQNFTFLPKPFNTIGLQVNSTLMNVEPINSHQIFNSNDPAASAAIKDQINRNLTLATVKRSLNISLNYSLGRFGLNLESNYTGYVLKTVTQKTIKYSNLAANQYFNELQYQAPRELVDLRLDYKYSPRFTPYLEVRNLLRRPIIMSTDTLPFNIAQYGDPIYELGVRGVF